MRAVSRTINTHHRIRAAAIAISALMLAGCDRAEVASIPTPANLQLIDPGALAAITKATKNVEANPQDANLWVAPMSVRM